MSKLLQPNEVRYFGRVCCDNKSVRLDSVDERQLKGDYSDKKKESSYQSSEQVLADHLFSLIQNLNLKIPLTKSGTRFLFSS